MSWWDSYRTVYRTELKAGALGLVDHGWPVLPGTFWQGGRWTGLGPAGATPQSGPVPALRGRPLSLADATDDPTQVATWWSELPYSVLLATGLRVDVVEVPALVGRRVCAVLRSSGVHAPVAATPTGRWWLAMRAGEPLRPELASRQEVVLHGRGSYVVAPPSECPQGLVHWRASPAAGGWRLPDPYDVQFALVEALSQRPAAAGVPATMPAPVGPVSTGIRS